MSWVQCFGSMLTLLLSWALLLSDGSLSFIYHGQDPIGIAEGIQVALVITYVVQHYEGHYFPPEYAYRLCTWLVRELVSLVLCFWFYLGVVTILGTVVFRARLPSIYRDRHPICIAWGILVALVIVIVV